MVLYSPLIFLNSSVVLDEPLRIPAGTSVAIRGTGQVIRAKLDTRLFVVEERARLTLANVVLELGYSVRNQCAQKHSDGADSPPLLHLA